MDSKLGLEYLRDLTQRRLNTLRKDPRLNNERLLQSLDADEPTANRDTHSEGINERDSYKLNIYAEALGDPSPDVFARLGKLTKVGGTLDALLRTARPMEVRGASHVMAKFGFTEHDLLSEKSAMRDLHVSMHRNLRNMLVGGILAGEDDNPEHEAWKANFFTNYLVTAAREGMNAYEARTNVRINGVTYQEGVMLPLDIQGREGLLGSGHAGAYAQVLRLASSSLDIGMFQFENTALMAETAMAMRRVGKGGGAVSLVMSAPVSITIRNALAMAGLRDFAKSIGLSRKDFIFDPVSLRRSNQDSDENPIDARIGESRIPTIAHQKFIGANLRSSDLKQRGFALGSANVTLGALGLFERDNLYSYRNTNVELTVLATYETMVKRYLKDRHGKLIKGEDGKPISHMDIQDFKSLTDAAATYASTYNRSNQSNFNIQIAGGKGGPNFLSSGRFAYKEINRLLREGQAHGKAAEAFFLMNVVSEGSVFDNLQRHISDFAGAGGKVTILMDGIRAANWEGTAVWDRIKAKFGHRMDLNAEEIRATGVGLEVMYELLGVDPLNPGNINILDNMGRRIHAKAFFMRAGGTDYGIVGSANVTNRSAGMDDERLNKELVYGTSSLVWRGLSQTLDSLIQEHGLNHGLRMAPATVLTPDQLRQSINTDYAFLTTPWRTAAGIDEKTRGLYGEMQQRLRRAGVDVSIRVTEHNSHLFSLNKRILVKRGEATVPTGVTVANLLNIEVMHGTDGTVYLPQYHKTLRGAVMLRKNEYGEYISTQKVGSEAILASAMKLADQYIDKKIIHGELRVMAEQHLRLESDMSARISEAAIDERVAEIIRDPYTQHRLRTKGRAFMLQLLGTFESEEFGRKAYRVKEHQFQAYEYTLDPLDLLSRPAEVQFREGRLNLGPGEMFFQRAADSYMMRSSMVNPVTGEPVEQHAKGVTMEGMKSLPMVHIGKDEKSKKDLMTFYIPMKNLYQMVGRLQNIMSASIWDMVLMKPLLGRDGKPLVDRKGREVSGPSPVDLFTAPMQSGDVYGPTGEVIERNLTRMYRFNTLMQVSPHLMSDVAWYNEAAFEHVMLVREQPTFSVKFDVGTANIADIAKKLNAMSLSFSSTGPDGVVHKDVMSARFTGETIDIGSFTVNTFGGAKTKNLFIKNPAAAYLEIGGFAQLRHKPVFRPDPANPNKIEVALDFYVYKPVEGGDRQTVGSKHLVMFMEGGSFANKVQTNMTGSRGAYMRNLMGIETSKDVHSITNKYQYKHADVLFQTGAYLLTRTGDQRFSETVQRGLDTNKTVEELTRRVLVLASSTKTPAANLKEAKKALSSVYGNGVDNVMAYQLAKILEAGSPDAAMNQIMETIRNVETEVREQKRNFLVNTDSRHRLATGLALFLHEQFFTQDYFNNRTISEFDLSRMKLPAGTKSFVGARIGEFLDSMESQQDRDEARKILTDNLMIPLISVSGFAANTTPISSRPEAQLLTYMNVADNSHLVNAMFPGMSEKQKAVLHMSSLMTHGAGMFEDRKMTVLRYGQLAAPMVAAVAEEGAMEDAWGTTKTPDGKTVRNRKHLGFGTLFDLAISMDKALHASTETDFMEPLNRSLETINEVAKGDPIAQRQRAGAAAQARTDSVNKRASGNNAAAFMSLLTKKGVGAMKFMLPILHMEQGLDGYTYAKVTAVYELNMPDPKVMQMFSAMGGGGDAAVERFREILHIMGRQHKAYEGLYRMYDDADSVAPDVMARRRVRISGDVANDMNKVLDLSLQQLDWFGEVSSNEMMKNVHGAIRGSGVTATVTYDPRVPLGVAVMGDVPLKRKLAAAREEIGKWNVEEAGKYFNAARTLSMVDAGNKDRVAEREEAHRVIQQGDGKYLFGNKGQRFGLSTAGAAHRLFLDTIKIELNENGKTNDTTVGRQVARMSSIAYQAVEHWKRTGQPMAKGDWFKLSLAHEDKSFGSLREKYQFLEKIYGKPTESISSLTNLLSQHKTTDYAKLSKAAGAPVLDELLTKTRADFAAITAGNQRFKGVFDTVDSMKTNMDKVSEIARRYDPRFLKHFHQLSKLHHTAGVTIDALMANTELFGQKTMDVEFYDEKTKTYTVETLDISKMIEGRAKRAKARLAGLIEKGVSSRKFQQEVTNTLLDLVVSSPKYMMDYGGRAGSPLTTEWNLNTVLSIHDLNDLVAANQLQGEKISTTMNRSMVMLGPTAQGMTLGDFDGDMNSMLDTNRLMYLDAKQKRSGLTADEEAQLRMIYDKLKQSRGGRVFVQSAARYSGRSDLLQKFDGGDTHGAIRESHEIIMQTRGLFQGLTDNLDAYTKHINAIKNDGKFAGMDLKTMHALAAERTVNDTGGSGMGALFGTMATPVQLNNQQLTFLQDYIGFAGTEIIGKGFNTTMDLLVSASVLSGASDGRGEQFFRGEYNTMMEAATNKPAHLTQMDLLAGFIRDVNQMGRESMKPRNTRDDQKGLLHQVDKLMTQWGTGSLAAVNSVTGARTISYLRAILQNKDYAVDLLGNPLDNTLNSDQFLSTAARPMDTIYDEQKLRPIHKKFIQVAAIEQARFAMDNIYNGKVSSPLAQRGMQVAFHTLKDVFFQTLDPSGRAYSDVTTYADLKNHTDLQSKFDKFVQSHNVFTETGNFHQDPTKAYRPGDKRARTGEGVAEDVLLRERTSLLEQALVEHYQIETSKIFSSAKNVEAYYSALDSADKEADPIRRRQILQAHKFDLAALPYVGVMNEQAEVYTELATSAAANESFKSVMGSHAIDIEAKLHALMNISSRPHRAQVHRLIPTMMNDIISSATMQAPDREFVGLHNMTAEMQDAWANQTDNMDKMERKIGTKLVELVRQQTSGRARLGFEDHARLLFRDIAGTTRQKISTEAMALDMATNLKQMREVYGDEATNLYSVLQDKLGSSLGFSTGGDYRYMDPGNSVVSKLLRQTEPFAKNLREGLKGFIGDEGGHATVTSSMAISGSAVGAIHAFMGGQIKDSADVLGATIEGAASMTRAGMSQMILNTDKAHLLQLGASFAAGAAIGTATEKLYHRFAPGMGHQPSRFGSGIANAIGGVVGAELVGRLLGAFHKAGEQTLSEKRIPKSQSLLPELFNATAIESLMMGYQESFGEDQTQVAELYDDEGNMGMIENPNNEEVTVVTNEDGEVMGGAGGMSRVGYESITLT